MRVFRTLIIGLALVAIPLVGLRGLPSMVVAAQNGRDLTSAKPETMGVSSERLQRLHAGMQRFVDEGRLAGVTTTLARRGRVVDFHAVGKKDVRMPDPVGRDSIFRIYSMTKPISGVAMMMLYEEGKWRLEDPVSRHIPEFAKLQVYTGDNPDGTMKLEPARRAMTMRELMTHSAGLGYVLNQTNAVDRLIIKEQILNPAAPLQAMIDKLATTPLLAHPGTRWYYSIAVDVQGYLVEKLSGQPFADFLKSRLFDPLGMKDTAFYVPKEKLGRLARIHTDGQGGKIAPPSDHADDYTVVPVGPSGGGGLFSTSDDYLRFAQMLLNGGELNGRRYLAPRTVHMMRTNHLQADALATVRPGTGWGMDFRVIMDAAIAGEPVSDGTFDWFGLGGTWFWIDPTADLVFVGMIQHRGRANSEIQGISRNLVYQALVN
ncbi:MAG: serine hydrolase domain-containing protein [Acidobacteriota bacterium]